MLCRWSRWKSGFAIAAVGVMTALTSHNAWAIPAFARRFDTKCETCHSPVPPRLNNVGIAFRRLGFRLPDADEKGNLTLKEAETKNAFDNFSVIGEVPLTYKTETGAGEGSTQLAVNEVEFRGAGHVGKGFSFSTVYEALNDDGAQELETFEGQYSYGTPERMFTVRAGQFFPLIWQKNLTNRLTVNEPLALVKQAGIGTFAGFKPKRELRGVEFGYNLNKLAGGKLTSTFLSGSIFNGVNEEAEGVGPDVDNKKDFMLQAMHLWGEANTVSAFYYDGRTTIDPTSTAGGPFAERFNRLGLMGNYRVSENTDLVAGYLWGRDDSDETGTSQRSAGYFIEVDHTLKAATENAGGTAAILRYDFFDPNKSSASGVSTAGLTVGLAHRASDNVLLNLEFQRLRGAETQNQVTAEMRFLY